MTEYNAPSLDEGTDDALAPRNDAFPFRSDESIDDLFAYNGDEGSGASPEGDNGQSRNRGASRQNGEVPHESGNGQNQSDAVGLGNDATPKKSDDVNSSDVLFDDLGLPEDLLSAVKELGFSAPTAIQAAAIPILLRGKDVVGVAQTGTGKTAAFALPLLAHIDPEKREVQALVLAPTRELAMQGAQAIESFAAKSRGVDVAAVYGGSSYLPQLKALEGGAQVVVGTSWTSWTAAPFVWTPSATSCSTRPTKCSAWDSQRTSKKSPPKYPRVGYPRFSRRLCRRRFGAWPNAT